MRQGYIFLVSVIVIGSIAVAATMSLMLLGWVAEQNGVVHVRSNQALEMASTCIERGIESLRSNLYYAGNVSYAYPNGSCQLGWIGGSGNDDRILCSEGISNRSTRFLRVKLSTVFPSTTIASWEEVADLNCGGVPGWVETLVASSAPGSGGSSAPASSAGSVASSAPASSAGSAASSASSVASSVAACMLSLCTAPTDCSAACPGYACDPTSWNTGVCVPSGTEASCFGSIGAACGANWPCCQGSCVSGFCQ